MRIFIVGHTTPDLDSIASAYEYAEFLEKSKRYEGSEIIATRAGEPNKETSFIFEKFGAEMPKALSEFEIQSSDAFVLVDHNEESQRHEKVKSDQVIEIVDHHKINVNFSSPVRIDVKPLGCTSTIIYEQFETYGLAISKETKVLILSGILSDTVGLKSNTTTGIDSELAHKLAKELELDLTKTTFEIFREKSNVNGMTPIEIVKKDFKVFDFSGKRVFIGQIETVEPEQIITQKEALIKALEEARIQENASQSYLIITDILKINSLALYTNDIEKAIVEKGFITQGHNGIADIGPKMSRKKDIAPAIEKAQ